MSGIIKDIGKAKDWVQKKNIKIVLSMYRLEDGCTLDYDIYAGDRLLQHVCSYRIEEAELKKFYERQWDCISRSH